ncbi:MAG TPA: hypothetical protein VKV27_04610 [Solirubrobacteraceae bacterium]|nr:hypothetical protein [Solirubrobacteraceae bacterium]
MGCASLFAFVQLDLPWPLGPPDGRYLVRAPSGGQAAAQATPSQPSHVLVLSTLASSPARRWPRRASRRLAPGAAPPPVAVGRATIIGAAPLADEAAARGWLGRAGERELRDGVRVLNRALHAYRLATGDPWLRTVSVTQALATRAGYGAGEQVAEGAWIQARELRLATGPSGRRSRLAGEARLAAALTGRASTLACEELTLRARMDLEEGRPREAALQLLAALDSALTELAADPAASALAGRLAELAALRQGVSDAARALLSGERAEAGPEVAAALERLQAALRARAAGPA